MTMDSGSAIVARGVRKSFGDHIVLDQVDLEVAEGSVFALLGPNGAGKTTMVRILSTLITADAGDIRVAGCDVATNPDGVRAAIGVTGQFSAVDNLLTGQENLRLMADLRHIGRERGRQRAAELLDQFDLADAAHKPLSTYSGGMRRRLDLAMTLVGDPRVIFLDEPTAGLDPRSRRTMWQDHRRAGRRRRHDPADHPIPRGSRSTRRPDRRPRPWARRRAWHVSRTQKPRPRRPAWHGPRNARQRAPGSPRLPHLRRARHLDHDRGVGSVGDRDLDRDGHDHRNH